MNELFESTLLVIGLLTVVSALLYVLAVIDPQTDRDQVGSHAGLR